MHLKDASCFLIKKTDHFIITEVQSGKFISWSESSNEVLLQQNESKSCQLDVCMDYGEGLIKIFPIENGKRNDRKILKFVKDRLVIEEIGRAHV